MKRIQRVLNIIKGLELSSICIYLLITWNSIPDIVGTHFDFNGAIDGFGSKRELLMYPILCAFLLYVSHCVYEVLSNKLCGWIQLDKVRRYHDDMIVMCQLLGIYVVAFMMILLYSSIHNVSPGIWFSYGLLGGIAMIVFSMLLFIRIYEKKEKKHL